MIKDGKYTDHTFRFDIAVKEAEEGCYPEGDCLPINSIITQLLAYYGITNAKEIKITKLQI